MLWLPAAPPASQPAVSGASTGPASSAPAPAVSTPAPPGLCKAAGLTGTIDSTGTLTIGEHARIRGEIRTKSVKVRGTVEGNAVGYAKFFSRSHDAVIRVYDTAR